MKKMLITGANGQFGRDAHAFFRDSYLCSPLTAHELDITVKSAVDAVFDTLQPDICLNCAAMTKVDLGETDLSARAYQVNRDGVAFLAQACRRVHCILIHFSTDYVFDGWKTEDYTEEDIPNPLNVYGHSKRAGELAVLESGCQFFLLRTAWLYGYQGNNFVKTMLRRGREYGEVSVVTDQRGNPTSTLELCRMTNALLKTGHFGLYHTTSCGICSWNEFAREIFDVYGLDVMVRDLTSQEYVRPAQRPARTGLSTDKLTRVTGYLPHDWRFCLREYHQRGAAL